MLLRRFTEHVKDQNWFAVALDFCIVVTGVIVAFQLQAWGERRAAEARADRSLHQLYAESEEALEFWIGEVSRSNSPLELMDRVIGALDEGERGDLSDEDLVQGMVFVGRYPTLSPPRRTYDELSGAGLLREIDAPEALATVADYYEGVDFIQGQIVFFRPTGWSDNAILDRLLTPHFDRTLATRQRLEADFADVARDREYLGDLIGAYRNQLMFQFYRRGMMHEAAEMCAALADAAGETCEGLAAYEEWRELPEWQMRDVPPREN